MQTLSPPSALEDMLLTSPRDEGTLPYSFRVVEAKDVDAHAENINGWDQVYDQISPGRFEGYLMEAWFGEMQLFHEITNQSLHETGSAWPSSLGVGLPFSMEGPAQYCGQPMTSDMLLTVREPEEMDFRTPHKLDIAGLMISSELLQSYCSATEGYDIESAISGRLIQGTPARLMELRTLLMNLFDMLKTSHSLLNYSQVQKVLQDTLITTLLSLVTDAQPQPIRWRAVSHRKVVERAKEYVLSNSDDPVTVAELCNVLGVSRRTLQSCFQETMGTNPVQYLRAVRLNEVRRTLRSCTDVTVQDVSARWGFWHLSKFSADYKKLFGELPSQTLASSKNGRSATLDNGNATSSTCVEAM